MAKTPRPIGPLTLAVAEELRALAARQQKSARQLADSIGVANSSVSRALKGERALTLEELEDLAVALGTTAMRVLARAEAHAPSQADHDLAAYSDGESIGADELPNEA